MTDIKENNNPLDTAPLNTGTDAVSKKDILFNFIKPSRTRVSVTEKIATVSLKYSSIVFTKSMIFDLGMAKKIAFSFTNDEVFIIANSTLQGIESYPLRKISSKEDIARIIVNKSLILSLYLVFGIDLEINSFSLISKYELDINGNDVHKLLLKPKI